MNSDAWLLDCGSGLRIAVGDREMIELVRQQDCFPVPGAPDYCREVLRWQECAVPVMDIARLHGARQLVEQAYVCVLNYLDTTSAALHPVGIRVACAPSRIVVADSQVCAWPDDTPEGSRLRAVAMCCFEHDGRPVMILDIARLCSAEFRELASAA